MKVKSLIKKFLPSQLLSVYHFAIANAAAIYYKVPSKKMVVIGITGTKGKSTTANFIWSALNAAGYKTGLIGTANIRIGDKEMMNKYHMTMPGRGAMQNILAQMTKEGCQYCIMEATSEGLKQWRHKGIHYDMGVFTNLTPEHLQSHGGSFEEYKKMKGRLFAAINRGARKTINGKDIEKVIIANYDSEHKDFYLGFAADKKITYGKQKGADLLAEKIQSSPLGVEFEVEGEKYKLSILGNFNVYNALPAIAVAQALGIPKNRIQKGLEELQLIPGRMEKIDLGQDFTLIVDYAHEKESMTAILDTAQILAKMTNSKIIILLGAEGGGRDKAKRPIMGEIAAKNADYMVVSNVDPYEDDPTEIVEDIAVAAEESGKTRGEDLFVIEDRRKGINKALSLAKKDDVVLITGKGAEQSIVIDGKKSDWDDREVVREELQKVLKKQGK